MAPPPVELTKGEERVQIAGAAFISLGSIAVPVAWNVAGVWWPAVVYGVLVLVLFVGMAVHLSRTRERSFWSVLLLGLPERIRARRDGG